MSTQYTHKVKGNHIPQAIASASFQLTKLHCQLQVTRLACARHINRITRLQDLLAKEEAKLFDDMKLSHHIEKVLQKHTQHEVFV